MGKLFNDWKSEFHCPKTHFLQFDQEKEWTIIELLPETPTLNSQLLTQTTKIPQLQKLRLGSGEVSPGGHVAVCAGVRHHQAGQRVASRGPQGGRGLPGNASSSSSSPSHPRRPTGGILCIRGREVIRPHDRVVLRNMFVCSLLFHFCWTRWTWTASRSRGGHSL